MAIACCKFASRYRLLLLRLYSVAEVFAARLLQNTFGTEGETIRRSGMDVTLNEGNFYTVPKGVMYGHGHSS